VTKTLVTAGDRRIQRTTLPNGLTVLTERMEHLRSVSMGVWVKTGSRDERAEVNGISHFVEHMVFKGTKNRTAQRIAREMDSLGGNLDAFTGKETVCFNVKVLDEHLEPSLDVLSDLVLNPIFAGEDIRREQGVILEEIKMDEDNPDYLVHETFLQNFWKDHPLGKPILGTKDTVRSFEHSTLMDFYGGHFRGGNLVISAAGNLQHERLLDLILQRFDGLAGGETVLEAAPPEPRSRIVLKQKKALEQVQLVMGVPAPKIADASRYCCFLLNTVLGGGMSSRLFQKVREERGMAYSIGSELNSFRDTGTLCVYAGTSKANVSQVIRLTIEEFRRLKTELVPAEELQRAKDQLKGNILLGLESSSSRMSNLARQEMYFDHFFSTQEIVENIERVTAEDVQSMAQSLFTTEAVAVTVLGNLPGLKVTRDLLVC
jgi:predicted Zn-dependent peptidase